VAPSSDMIMKLVMPAQEQHSASPNDVKPGPLLANVLGTASPRSKLRSPQ